MIKVTNEYFQKTLRSLGIVLAGTVLTWIHANVIQTKDPATVAVIAPLYCVLADYIRRQLGIGEIKPDPVVPESDTV